MDFEQIFQSLTHIEYVLFILQINLLLFFIYIINDTEINKKMKY